MIRARLLEYHFSSSFRDYLEILTETRAFYSPRAYSPFRRE